MNFIKYYILLLIFSGCSFTQSKKNRTVTEKSTVKDTINAIVVIKQKDTIKKIFSKKPDYLTFEFYFHVGKHNAKGYYNTQGFGEDNHLGDDWNAITGGNLDLGGPIYAIANGYVNFAKDMKGGWGKVIRVYHQTKNRKNNRITICAL